MDRGTGRGTAAQHSTLGQGARSGRVLALVVGLFVVGAIAGVPALFGASAPARAAAQGDATPAAATGGATPVAAGGVGVAECPAELYGEGAEPWVRADLFFGTTRPDGTIVSEEEWQEFLDTEITPRFPDGLTVLTGYGQFRREDGTIIEEQSQVLIILYPAETAAESSDLLEEIRAAYEEQFEQSSVLRTDITPVCTSF